MITIATVKTFINNVIRKVTVGYLGRLTSEAIEVAPFGVDSNPIANMQAVYADTENSQLPVIIGYLNISALAAPGEHRTYSVSGDGSIQASAWLKASGDIIYTGQTMELLGNANHAAQYEGTNNALTTYF